MTKDTAEFSQIHKYSGLSWVHFAKRRRRIWTKRLDQREHQKLGSVLEGTTCCLQGKHGVEIRIMSLRRDNTHSWVRLSHGSIKFVMNLNNNETEIPEVQLEENALKLNAKDFASRAKVKAKPQRREPAGSSPRIVPIDRRNWIDIEPGKHSLSEYEVSKKVIHLLRHSQKLHREEDGAVHFWRIIFRIHSHNLFIGLTIRWKACFGSKEEEQKGCFSIALMTSGTIVYLRALQGHSGRSLIDPSLQDNVLIPVTNSGLIPGGQNLSKRQTVFFTSVGPMNEEHKDPNNTDLEAPRLAQYMHNAWKKHQNTV